MESPTATQPSLTCDIQEAAEFIGVHPGTVRRLVEDGELPGFRCGRGKSRGKILIRRQAVLDWIAKREAVGVL